MHQPEPPRYPPTAMFLALALMAVAGAVLPLARIGPGTDGPQGESPATPESKSALSPATAPDPAPLYSPAEALPLFKLDPRFRISLAAAEPMIEAPVALAFDEDGRAWVCEMRGYMRDTRGTTEGEPTGRISVLEDTDGDGVFDKSTVFLDKLVMPRAVMPCRGGALVLEPPSLYFCRDTDGDGVCDEKRKLADGLAGENPEHAPNGLMYGLDNWIKLSQSPVEFRFDGEKLQSRKTPAHGQWGITQDDLGRLYYAPNPEALRGDLYPKHYAARNPAQRERPGINELICRDQTVWPSRPTPGVNRGYMEGILRPDGTLAAHTAACSPLHYRASLMDGCRNDEFVCEPAAFMVRRLKLTETEIGPRARNAYDHAEFLTSTDERFRPVSLAVGPDGALYIVDMHRGVIQHKTYLTPYLQEQIDTRKLEAPVDCGRIYRITRASGGAPARPAEKLSDASNQRLVELLADPEAVWRQNAQRLLVDRRAVAMTDDVRRLARDAVDPAARLQALWTLEGLGSLVLGDAIAATHDKDPSVRAAGVRLAEAWLNSDENRSPVLARLSDIILHDSRGPVLQATLSLGQCKDVSALQLMAAAAGDHGGSDLIRAAIISGIGGRECEFLSCVTPRPWLDSAGLRAVVADAAESVLRSGSVEQHSRFAEMIVALGAAPKERPEAEFLLARLRAVQQIDAPAPKVLKLAREPAGWAELASGTTSLARDTAECAFYLDWPGRPHVDPPKKARALTPAEQKRFEQGKALFNVCAGCHGAEGQGMPGQIPPLAGSARAQGPSARAIRVLLHGLEGPLGGGASSTINGSMPPPPFQHDDELAAVLTYVRQAWGNNGEPVSREDVAKVRAETRGRTNPWKAEELDAIR